MHGPDGNAPGGGGNKRPRKAFRALLTGHRVLTVVGKDAEMLLLLIKVGARGVTSGEASHLGWARRTSAYVHSLRCKGVAILTLMEDVGDGTRIARYVLDEPVTVAPYEPPPPPTPTRS